MQDDLKTKLTNFGLSEEQVGKLAEAGVATESDMALLTSAEVQSTTACGLVVAKKVAAAFAPAPAAAPATGMMMAPDFNMVLPTVPDDASFLKALQTGGVLKVDTSTVISAVRAALAQRVGLFDVPKRLVEAMERFTDETEDQVSPEFFEMRKLLTRNEYGDLFAAIPGLDGNFVTKARKDQLLSRIDDTLWPAVIGFNEQLTVWQENWLKGAANPAMLMMMLAGGRGAMPPGMGQAPDTGGLRDAASAVNDAVNKVFRGTGAQISAALAYEANRIKESLVNPSLPHMVGAPNREQMLKKLGISVAATYPRLEANVTQFVLSVMQADTQPAGEEELRYFGALQMLGSQIDWNQLMGRSFAGGGVLKAAIGGGRRPLE